MSTSELSSLTSTVLWAAFFLSAIFGALNQRTGFCTMGAVSDVLLMGDWDRMRQWALAAGAAILGFAALVATGQIEPAKTLYASTRLIWLSALSGGLLFGFGMVLTSGCVSKTLVRIGGGNIKSLVVALVLGVTSFMTLKGLTAVWRTNTVDRVATEMPGGTSISNWLAQATGMSASTAALLAALVIGGGLVIWALSHRGFRNANNLLAGLGVAAVITTMWWVSGHLGFVIEHPETLEETFLATNSGRAEAFSFLAPVAYTLDWLMFFSDKNKLLTVGIVSVVGVIVGSFITSMVQRSFRWEGFGNTRDLGHHLVGAVLMGVGGVTAMGCSIGQGVSGVSTLSAVSFIAVAGIISGAVLGLKYQTWRMEQDL